MRRQLLRRPPSKSSSPDPVAPTPGLLGQAWSASGKNVGDAQPVAAPLGSTHSDGPERSVASQQSTLVAWPVAVRRTLTLLPAILAALMLSIGLAVYWMTWRSTQRIAGENLHSILAANVAGLELWLRDQNRQTTRLLRGGELAPALTTFLLSRSTELPTAGDLSRKIDTEVGRLDRFTSEDSLGWIVTDDRGEVVLASQSGWVGIVLDELADDLERAFRSGQTVAPALRMPATESHPGGPSLVSLAAVREGVRPIGALGRLIDPAGRFTRLLAVARTGSSGETYAFDERGVMISRSRFERQLGSIGLLDPDSSQDSILRVSLRDPGRDLRHAKLAIHERSAGYLAGLPRTAMAEQIQTLREGILTDGYRDYRGVTVIGAWQWLEEFDFGVVSEIDADEAFHSVGLLGTALWITLLTSVPLAFLLIGVMAWANRLHTRALSAQSKVRRMGQYELSELVGRGGMGTVYRGRHSLLSRDVAIKVLELVDQEDRIHPLDDQRAIIRFEREVRATSQLRHPNTVDIHDYGRTTDGTFFYVMEFIEGVNLRELCSRTGAQPSARVIHLLMQLCGSVQEAHQRGLIHRDIKPGNLLLTHFPLAHDVIKVLDFGLVRRLSADTFTPGDAEPLTRTDSLMGTPMYLPPELIRRREAAGVRSDIYAIGAVGYQLLCGLTPYAADSVAEVCALRMAGDPMRPSERIGEELPDDLQNVLMSCLRANPDDRPATAVELAESLRLCQDFGVWGEDDARVWWQTNAGAMAERSHAVWHDPAFGGDREFQHPSVAQHPPVARGTGTDRPGAGDLS